MSKPPMRSRLVSDFSNTPFPRSRSPFQLERHNDDNGRHNPHDRICLIQRSDPVSADTLESDLGSSEVPFQITVTPSPSLPPSPGSSSSSFNSSQDSSYDPFTLHPMSSETSLSSIHSTRSMPPLEPSRSTKHRLKPKPLFLNDSSPCLDKQSVGDNSMTPRLLRSNSISSSLRVLKGGLRRKKSTLLVAATPSVTITPSTPTVMSPRSPMSFMSPMSPMSPISPTEPPPEAERRMRQFHKVTRTLGENIPIELFFGSLPNQEDYADPLITPRPSKKPKSFHRPNISISSYTPFIIPQDDSSTSDYSLPSTPSSMTFDFDLVQNGELGSTIMSPITFAVPSPPAPPPAVLPDFPEDVSSDDSPYSPISRPASPDRKMLGMLTRPDTPFLTAAVPINENSTLQPDYSSVVRREKRQGWSGEWNRQDMQDVIAKLRQLK